MMKKSLRGVCVLLSVNICALGMTGCQLAKNQQTNKPASEFVTGTEQAEEKIEDFATWKIYSAKYLTKLKDTYQLEELTKECNTDFEKVETITKWVSGLWNHNGENQPKRNDPLYILDQVVNNGQQYRCVEYGIVIAGCLQALGMDCRQLCLKMEDVETIESGAGHVGSEVFLNDLKKWVFIDGQWGAIPMLGDTPLNAYEFGQAIRNQNPDLNIYWVNNIYNATDSSYYDWVKPYLFYLDTTYLSTKGKQKYIMYVPETGKEVTVFQKKYSIYMDQYIRNIKEFYLGQEEMIESE